MKTALTRIIVAFLLAVAGSSSARATITGVHIECDDVPNLYDLPSFVADVTEGLTTNRAKAIALWGKVVELMPQSPGSFDPILPTGSNGIDDPIKLWNVFGFGYCSYDSRQLQACFRELGWPARNWEVTLHTVGETFYDGGWHLLDASHERYFPHPVDGHLASHDELAADSSLTFCSNQVFYFPGGPEPPTGGLDPQDEYNTHQSGYLGTTGLDEFAYGHCMDISLKRGETFTRYWDSLGTSSDYWYGQSLTEAPYWYDGSWGHIPCYANGRIEFTPALSDVRYREDIEEEVNVSSVSDDGQTPNLHLTSAGTGYVVYRVRSPYIITSATFSGEFVRAGASDAVRVYVCPFEGKLPSGTPWGSPVWTASGTGTVTATDVPITQVVRGRYSYLVKVEFASSGAITDAGIDSLSFDTIVQNAKWGLPRLKPGPNTIRVTSKRKDIIYAYPWITTDDVFNQAYRYTNMMHFDEESYMGMLLPSIQGAWGELVYKYDPPGEVTDIEFGGHFNIVAAASPGILELAYSWDDVDYTTILTADSSGGRRNENLYQKITGLPPGHGEIYLRYRMMNPILAHDIFMKVFYTPVAPNEGAPRITYGWDDGGVQTHTETATTVDHTYTINTNPGIVPTNLQPPYTTFNRYVRLEYEEYQTDVEPEERLALLQGYPNPFHGGVLSIPFVVDKDCRVRVEIFDGSGRAVRSCDLGAKLPGSYASKGSAFAWDGKDASGRAVPAGRYAYRITIGERTGYGNLVVTR